MGGHGTGFDALPRDPETDLREAIDELEAMWDEFVVAVATSETHADAKGISVFFPRTPDNWWWGSSALLSLDDYTTTDFSRETSWGAMIQAYEAAR